MKNKKFRYTILISLIFILIGIIYPPNSVIKSTSLSENNREIDTDIIRQAAYWELNYIDINNNWSETASTYDWCTGSGTFENPYIIENITITLGGSEFGIKVQNSAQYFIIQNCTVNNQANGIYIVNCSNGLINNNFVSLHSNGILIDECDNLILSNNEITESSYGIRALNGTYNRVSFNFISECGFAVYIIGSDSYKFIIDNNHLIKNMPGVYLFGKGHELFNNTLEDSGITIGWIREEVISYNIDTSNTLNNKPIYYYAKQTNLSSLNFINSGQILLAYCNDSKVADLNFSNTGLPIMMVYCSNNEISNISIMNETYGIGLAECENNTFKYNEIKQCGIGIWLLGYCDNNNFTNNEFNNNSHAGIKIHSNNDNLFSYNLFKDNDYGLYFAGFSERNLVYKNVFINNTIHAYDVDTLNYWDNGMIGNYWDDYNGTDLNFDGIGDSPYNISGPVLNQDNFPLIYPPSPEISIMKPSENTIFGETPPDFEILLQGFNIVSIWYTIDNGTHNYTITELTGTINQTAWNSLAEGPVTIRFYIRDIANREVFEEVIVVKRTTYVPSTPPGISGYNVIALIGMCCIITLIIVKMKRGNIKARKEYKKVVQFYS